MNLLSIRQLVFEHGDKTEGTQCPFWYIAVHSRELGRPVMISHGIWFSRESAENYFETQRHAYPNNAYVYCDSAFESHTGLRRLMEKLTP